MLNDAKFLVDALTRMADLAATAAPAAVVTAMAETTGKAMHNKLGGGPPPSAPGTPPAYRTGTLQGSVTVTPPVESVGYAEATVGPTAVYGRIHEFGGDTGRGHATHLPPRPYVGPSVEESLPELEAVAVEAFRFATGLVL